MRNGPAISSFAFFASAMADVSIASAGSTLCNRRCGLRRYPLINDRTPLITLADAQTPPLRLALVTDTLKAIAEKNAPVEAETDAWRESSSSTDFAV